MSEAEFSFLPLQVLRVGAGGKRTFEPEGKRRLIEACRQPDVSLSGMALKAGINANQLRKWIRRSEQRKAVLRSLPAFVPVVAVDGAPPPPGKEPTVRRPGGDAHRTHQTGCQIACPELPPRNIAKKRSRGIEHSLM